MTGPGVEYAGHVNATKSGYPCVKWTDVTADDPNSRWPDSRFPDGDRAAARDRCRNPSGDPGGPWCYASMDDGATVPDYCDTAGCDAGRGSRDDDRCDWTLAAGFAPPSARGHYTAVSVGDDGDARFQLKPWLPVAAGEPFRFSLTAYPTGFATTDGGFEVAVPHAAFVSADCAAVRMGLSWRNDFIALTAAKREVLGFEWNSTATAPLAYVSVAADAGAPVAVRLPYCSETGTVRRCYFFSLVSMQGRSHRR